MKKTMLFLLYIPLVIFIIFEYFLFVWFWGGDGEFAFFGCGISFIVYLVLHIFAFLKAQNKLKKIIIYSAVILTPILSVITVYLILAPLFGISIQIA